MIRDRFVVGLSDAKLSESLQMDANLTLVSALAKARLKETVQRQQQQLRETSDEPSAAPASNLDAVNKQRQPRKNSSGQRSGTSSRTSAPVTQGQRTRPQSYRPLTSGSCPNCGQGEHPRTSCPARAAKCNYCGCSGHFAVVCRKKSAGERKKVPISSLHMEKGAYFVGAVNGEHSNSRYAQVIINGTPVFAKLDSGAKVSVVPSTFPGLPTKLDKCDITLTGPANEPRHVLGKFLATIQWRQRIVRQTVYVVSPLRSILLGLPALEALELIKFADSPKEGEDEADSDDFPQADDSRVETEQNSNRVTDSMAPDDLSSPSLPGTDLPEYQTRSGRLVRRPDRYGFSN
ncbi:hypothetical protein MRX96_012138 [Rhipicephalus microplus]